MVFGLSNLSRDVALATSARRAVISLPRFPFGSVQQIVAKPLPPTPRRPSNFWSWNRSQGCKNAFWLVPALWPSLSNAKACVDKLPLARRPAVGTVLANSQCSPLQRRVLRWSRALLARVLNP